MNRYSGKIQRASDPLLQMRARNSWIVGHFEGDDVFIVAGGPSLKGFDFERLTSRRVIAINNAIHFTKPEILVYLDSAFRAEYVERTGSDIYDLPCRVITQTIGGAKSRENVFVALDSHARFVADPARLYRAASSTLVAISVAILGRARTIYLLGLDGGYEGDEDHFYSFEGRPKCESKKYENQTEAYSKLVGLAKIVNLNPRSRVRCFEFATVDEVLGAAA